MEHKEWNKTLDRYLIENEISCGDYESLDEIQMAVIQEIKKAKKRLNKTNEEKTYQ